MKRIILISVLLITALGFAVYANSLGGKFLWDDRYLVTHNIYTKNLSYLPNVFTQAIGAGAGMKSTSYRPLQMFTYMIDYSLWKLNPAGYHFTNILFHVLAALCVFWLINILFGDWRLSLFTSVLFVVHPIHTEAVAYISGRADPMALVFLLLAFIFYIKSSGNGLALLCYTLALLAREGSMILPVLILLYHYAFKKPLKLKGTLPILVITFLYLFFREAILKSPLPHNLAATTLGQRLPGFFAAVTNYIKLLFLPFGLHMEYGSLSVGFTNYKSLLGVLLLAFLIFLAVKNRVRDRLIFFSIAWFIITILPVSNIYPLNTYMAEHWLYLPSVGFFLLIAKGLTVIARGQASRCRGVWPYAPTLILIIFYSFLTIRQNTCWKEPMVFYTRLLKYAPYSARLHNDVGIAYSDLGDNDTALALFKKAAELDPGYPNPYNNIGTLYSYMDKRDEAIAMFKKAIEIDSEFPDSYSNLANIYVSMGKDDEAIQLYKKALELNPVYAAAYNNIAAAYYNKREYDSAVKYCDRAIELGHRVNPGFVKELQKYRK